MALANYGVGVVTLSLNVRSLLVQVGAGPIESVAATRGVMTSFGEEHHLW